MPTEPTGEESEAVYTKTTLIEPWVPSNYQTAQLPGGGPSNVKGQVSIDDITGLINQHSRTIDARLWAVGMQTPFTDIAVMSGPLPPQQIQRATTFMVASDIRAIMKFGSRRGTQASSTAAKKLQEDAEEIIAAIEERPHSLGKVRVIDPEDFTTQMVSGSVVSGKIMSPWYRLKNRNCVRRSLRFVTSAGVEVLRNDALPFTEGIDWAWVSAAEGVIAIGNTMVLAQIGAGGGVQYDWGYVRLDRFNLHRPSIVGVSR